MTLDKTPPHIKLDERNHVETPLQFPLNMPDWGIITLMQYLLTGKVRVTPLLTEPQEAGA
uniref:Uncharacterized protein n=1 Tax=Candidatus Methanogaster sp. ANME-2c ERB4 TaxID=2759911 RepID=A0A7G9Y8J1_9EURY|nr:hypothetical protein JKAPHALJ_00012 [Methanosarcinales archaeon ANME-2c ERB4]QNO46492.1 hypothetical protein PAACNKLE_00028 [Methanosarcinales archaeon ANME-2c ERB4]